MQKAHGANCDEMPYAEDTICPATETKTTNKLIANILQEGARYGVKRNRRKRWTTYSKKTTNPRFQDGTQVQINYEAAYLGCQPNDEADTTI